MENRVKPIETALTVISIIITGFAISMPGFFITPENAVTYLNAYSLPSRFMILVLIELPLGYGFGYLFYLVSYIENQEKEVYFEDDPFDPKSPKKSI